MTKKPDIFVLDSDEKFAHCLERYIKTAGGTPKLFSNVFDINEALNSTLPSLIFFDPLLNGPDAFSLLNDLVSYENTASTPLAIVSNLSFSLADFEDYPVHAIFKKSRLRPEDIIAFIRHAGLPH